MRDLLVRLVRILRVGGLSAVDQAINNGPGMKEVRQ
jgi:hypothetical protein